MCVWGGFGLLSALSSFAVTLMRERERERERERQTDRQTDRARDRWLFHFNCLPVSVMWSHGAEI